MQHPEQGDGSDQGTLLPDLPGLSKKGRPHGDPQGHRNQRGNQKTDRRDRPEDAAGLKFDLIESTEDGCLVFGNDHHKAKDRASILIVPGLNDSGLLEMGRLGMLKGKAKEIYEKFSR
jgi:hypothetical protein